MPRMGGLDVCRQVKQNPALTTTFFILITSKISVDDRVQGLDAGADDFICKPIDLQELKARVRAGLRLHQLSQDLQKQKQLLEKQKKTFRKAETPTRNRIIRSSRLRKRSITRVFAP